MERRQHETKPASLKGWFPEPLSNYVSGRTGSCCLCPVPAWIGVEQDRFDLTLTLGQARGLPLTIPGCRQCNRLLSAASDDKESAGDPDPDRSGDSQAPPEGPQTAPAHGQASRKVPSQRGTDRSLPSDTTSPGPPRVGQTCHCHCHMPTPGTPVQAESWTSRSRAREIRA